MITLLFITLLIGFFDSLNLLVFVSFSILFLLYYSSFRYWGVFFVDNQRFLLLVLRLFLLLLCFYAEHLRKWGNKDFIVHKRLLFTIFLIIFSRFCCIRIMVFYFCFEFTFILMYIFLLGWGYRPERLQASFYIILFTLLVSFPFLAFLVSQWFYFHRTNFVMPIGKSVMWWFFFCLVFLVKLPVYGTHIWLPKAHVEAPVSGSMVLAGLLLKLGGYGLYRFSFLLKGNFFFKDSFFVSVGLVGGIIRCVLCLRQSDAKAFVAYSSVRHISMALASLCSLNFLGVGGIFLIIIGHGFCSSCLFYILYVLYKRCHSRRRILLKGMLFFIPFLGLVWFRFSILNMGVPPFLSFISELTILIRVMSIDRILLLLVALFLLIAGVYCVYLFINSNHGITLFEGLTHPLHFREYLLFYSHFFPIVWFTLYLNYLF